MGREGSKELPEDVAGHSLSAGRGRAADAQS